MADDRLSVMKRGDTSPPLPIFLLDNTAPKDISAATTVTIIGKKAGAVLFSRAVAERPADGALTLVWEADDTLTVGSINIEVEVVWPDATVQTFPAEGYLRVEVRADLG